MSSPRRTARGLAPRLALLVAGLAVTAAAARADMAVVATSPAAHAVASPATTIVVDFDQAVDAATVGAASFRVFGQHSGAAGGAFTLSAWGTRVTFTPDAVFTAGETVMVNLSHDIGASDGTPLRDAGWAFRFRCAFVPGSGVFQPIDVMSNTGGAGATRIDGAAAIDLDEDGATDLATVNEVSADVRVALNRGDGGARGLGDGAFSAPDTMSIGAHTVSTDLGQDLAGTDGVPAATGIGSLVGGTEVTITLADALAGTTAWLVVGTAALGAPFTGGVLVSDPNPPGFTVPLPAGPLGELVVTDTWPAGLPAGTAVVVQWWIQHGAGPVGFAASNALRGTVATVPGTAHGSTPISCPAHGAPRPC